MKHVKIKNPYGEIFYVPEDLWESFYKYQQGFELVEDDGRVTEVGVVQETVTVERVEPSNEPEKSQFVCDICGQTYKSQHALTRHKKAHELLQQNLQAEQNTQNNE